MDIQRTPRQVILEAEEEGGYYVYCPSLPGCHSQGFWQAFVVARNDVFWDVASLRQMAG